MNAALDSEVADRFNELGLPLGFMFDCHGSIVKFWEKQYILVVKDVGDNEIDAQLVESGGVRLDEFYVSE